ncbi:hypothetical protein NE865_00679 [Phthorimaea operculella]|nr:hypothetical protein NE865_00679 [Phthorimaea operculella]
MVNLCGRCGDEVADGVLCSVCLKHCHYGDCAGVTEGGFRRLGEKQQVWKCPSCKYGPTAANIAVALRTMAEGSLRFCHMPAFGQKPRFLAKNLILPSYCDIANAGDAPNAAAAAATPASTSNKNPSGSPSPLTLESVMDELNKIRVALEPLADMKKDIADLRLDFNKHLSKVSDMEDRLQKIEEAHAEIPTLKSRISAIEQDINDRNQWMRLNNAEIKGVPMKDHENLLDIVAKIGSKIMHPITKQQINFVARRFSLKSRILNLHASHTLKLPSDAIDSRMIYSRHFTDHLPDDVDIDEIEAALGQKKTVKVPSGLPSA